MGSTGNRKGIIIVVIFLLISIFVYGKPKQVRSIKKNSLNEVLTVVDGWKAGPHIPYDKEVINTLALDDYANRMYVKGDKSIFLYIGYYLTASKVGSAHDPLVCFPGQGWMISARSSGTIEVGEHGNHKVSYSIMTVKRGVEDSNVILYWFQANETANADTLSQKINAIMQKLTNVKDDNAFVRLTCATREKSESECIEIMLDFTKVFYPVFLDYIRE